MHASMRCYRRTGSSWLAWLAAVAFLCAASGARAHKASDAYVQMTGTEKGLTVRVDIALRDLDAVLDIDTDGNGQLTWDEIRTAWPAIEGYVASHVQIEGCSLGAPLRALERRADGVYAALAFASACTPKAEPPIRYTVFADVDPTHRGIARISIPGQPSTVRVLDPRQPLALSAAAGSEAAAGAGPGASSIAPSPAAVAQAPAGFLREGVHHIVTGYDHVLFLMCLLFPAVMRRTQQGWQPLQTLREALWPVLGIVTAFTVAHSITLALAALKWVSLPSWFIEPAIAVTIILAALNNLWPIFRGRVVWVTFAFGLLHGFGFASVLSELNLPTAQFAFALLQFNVGLELGQIMIVVVALSLMFLARNSLRYVPVVIRGGSGVAIAVALLWFVERTADIKLLPF
jgi:HupE / UreJ protein